MTNLFPLLLKLSISSWCCWISLTFTAFFPFWTKQRDWQTLVLKKWNSLAQRLPVRTSVPCSWTGCVTKDSSQLLLVMAKRLRKNRFVCLRACFLKKVKWSPVLVNEWHPKRLHSTRNWVCGQGHWEASCAQGSVHSTDFQVVPKWHFSLNQNGSLIGHECHLENLKNTRESAMKKNPKLRHFSSVLSKETRWTSGIHNLGKTVSDDVAEISSVKWCGDFHQPTSGKLIQSKHEQNLETFKADSSWNWTDSKEGKQQISSLKIRPQCNLSPRRTFCQWNK